MKNVGDWLGRSGAYIQGFLSLLEESRSKACSTQGEQSHYRSGELGLGIHGFIPT